MLIDVDQVHRRLARARRGYLAEAMYPLAVPLAVARWDVPGEPVPVGEALAARYEPAAVGDAWGPAWRTSWFRFTGTVPAAFAGQRVEARVDLGFTGGGPGFQAEGLAYRPDGSVIKAVQPRTAYVPVSPSASGADEPVEFYVEAAGNPNIDRHPGTGGGLGPLDRPLYTLARAELAVFDPEGYALTLDLDVLDELMVELPGTDARRFEIAAAVSGALDLLDRHSVRARAAEARARLAPALRVPARASAHRADAVGSAHIDTAWLWPIRETVRKAARTVANLADLAEHHPDLVFAMPQMQQMDWLKRHRPEVFARLRQLVADGVVVPVGGMWVEADGNLPGGESWARQFYYGRTFCRAEFGREVTVGWLPDSFGFSAALPQLHRLAGIDSFMTQKMSWNETNTMPHHTFRWEGIDGSRLFTHFHPVDTCNSVLSARELLHGAANFLDKGRARRSLTTFGYGDGGGGPTREMIGRAHRFADLDGAPRVRITTPEDFVSRARAEDECPPVWVGEMYLERHRGTFTTMAELKQGNRRNEHLLREAELWAATAAVTRGAPYPYEELDEIWRLLLLYQFHDILPGSSITWVHREAVEGHARLTARLEALVDGALRTLVTDPAGRTLFNAAPHARRGVAALGAAAPEAVPGTVDVARTGTGGVLLDNGILRVEVAADGVVRSVRDLAAGRELLAPGGAAGLLQLHSDQPNDSDAWDIDSFTYDIPPSDLAGPGALLEVDASNPAAPRVTVRRRFGAAASTAPVGSPARTALTRPTELTGPAAPAGPAAPDRASEAAQTITLHAGARQVDFTTEVDWHERELLMKSRFDLDVTARAVQAEVAYGFVERPTHTNTSWQRAHFEAYCHRFVRIAEPGHGVALLNAGVYGYDLARDVRADGGVTTTVRPTLLRGTRFPDPESDLGRHTFRYALALAPETADAVRDGYRMNLPERVVDGTAEVAPLVRVDGDGIVIGAVKLAGDRSGDVIVRLYEALGGRATGRLHTSFPLAGAEVVDLLEDPLQQRPPADRRAFDGIDATDGAYGADGIDGATGTAGTPLALRPFQILTLRLRPRCRPAGPAPHHD